MTSPTLSAVVVTHNSASVIDDCLTSLLTHLPLKEVIVVDNASTDGTQDLCSNVRLLPNAENCGFGRACNAGARAASGSHLLFLNPDVRVVDVDTLGLQAELLRRPFGLIGPLFDANGRTAPLLLPDTPWPVEVVSQGIGNLRPRELPRLPRPRVRPTGWWPAGAALVCSLEEFLGVGGFRPEFFLYYEDRDLARRYRRARLGVESTDSITVQHTAGTSSDSDDQLRIAANGWAYLGWLEFVYVWHGATRATVGESLVRKLWALADRALGRLEHAGSMSSRAKRKRDQLRGIGAFVEWQSRSRGSTADPSFCPHARRIVASRSAGVTAR